MTRCGNGRRQLHDALGVSMELNHGVPRWAGRGNNLENLKAMRPYEHAMVDRLSFYTAPKP